MTEAHGCLANHLCSDMMFLERNPKSPNDPLAPEALKKLAYKSKQKILALQGNATDNDVLDNDTVFLLSSILPIQPDTVCPCSGHQINALTFWESSVSPRYTDQDPQAIPLDQGSKPWIQLAVSVLPADPTGLRIQALDPAARICTACRSHWAEDPSPGSSWLYLYCLQIPLDQGSKPWIQLPVSVLPADPTGLRIQALDPAARICTACRSHWAEDPSPGSSCPYLYCLQIPLGRGSKPWIQLPVSVLPADPTGLRIQALDPAARICTACRSHWIEDPSPGSSCPYLYCLQIPLG
ncbi:hypothetical protein DUI87_15281 [Hirundo rustica rustica]|uniref:Uncharacterized protein n=1 Tax=Hirundo rustica rustica TaxID=333673 RepID=A0A3M0K3Q1_HIRRU|nr:hypothetical protein DUI87_15281 [Hirundo rustica rustica]